MTRTPRPYQTAATRAVHAAWAAGRMRPVVVLPTGAGKTVTASLAVAGVQGPVLAVSHTTTLREQLAATIPGCHSATVQGILSAGRLPFGPATVVIDECHHYAAGRWRRLLELIPAGTPCVLLTATPERGDGLPLGGPDGIATDLIAPVDYSTLLTAGHLCPVRRVDTRGMDPALSYLRHARAAIAAGRGGPGWRPGVLFAPTKASCAAAVRTLLECGVRAAVIDADTPDGVRRARFAAYNRGELDVLASPMALSEGFDAPQAAVCVLDRRCEHPGLYLQCAGRVLRPHPSKGSEGALLLDCVGAVERHGLPTDDRTYSLDGRGGASAIGRAVRQSCIVPRNVERRTHTSPVWQGAGRVVGVVVRSVWSWLRAA